MQIFHPTTKPQLAARDRLLQLTLRPESPACAIAAEYPNVLAAPYTTSSFCLGDAATATVLAHANLHPRKIQHSSISVGLVGNVASHPDYRGQGLIKQLILTLSQQAEQSGLAALVLWSDLEAFYQKLGFGSWGSEQRLLFNTHSLSHTLEQGTSIEQPAPASVSLDLAAACLALRDGSAGAPRSLLRSPEEFCRLLTIPFTDLFVLRQRHRSGANKLLAYAIVGKGYDMQGVIHEWGSHDASSLLQVAGYAARQLELPEIMLLAPQHLPAALFTLLKKQTRSIETHPMAWMRPLASGLAQPALLQDVFIWGLDSI